MDKPRAENENYETNKTLALICPDPRKDTTGRIGFSASQPRLRCHRYLMCWQEADPEIWISDTRQDTRNLVHIPPANPGNRMQGAIRADGRQSDVLHIESCR
jgi:hypothetical protein